MEGLPQELQYKPTQQFQLALQQLNKGLVEAGQRAQKPIGAQQALNDVMIPLFNLMANYLKMSQQDTYGYFYGLCGWIYNQQVSAADDNIILAVDPDLAEEVDGVVSAARENIGKTKAFIGKVQEYLTANKPAAFESADGYTEEEAKKAKAKIEANLEMYQALREEALRVMSALNESDEDLGIMADNVEGATYDPDSDSEDDEDGDEVALPSSAPVEDDEPYESVIG